MVEKFFTYMAVVAVLAIVTKIAYLYLHEKNKIRP
jgi:hypothetical protein